MDNVQVNFLLQTLLKMHKMTTMERPLCHNSVEVPMRIFANDVKNMDAHALTNRAYEIFETKKFARGSVHLDPDFWTTVFLRSLEDFAEKNVQVIKEADGSATISIPNGCCTTEKCPIKTFYEILASTLEDT